MVASLGGGVLGVPVVAAAVLTLRKHVVQTQPVRQQGAKPRTPSVPRRGGMLTVRTHCRATAPVTGDDVGVAFPLDLQRRLGCPVLAYVGRLRRMPEEVLRRQLHQVPNGLTLVLLVPLELGPVEALQPQREPLHSVGLDHGRAARCVRCAQVVGDVLAIPNHRPHDQIQADRIFGHGSGNFLWLHGKDVTPEIRTEEAQNAAYPRLAPACWQAAHVEKKIDLDEAAALLRDRLTAWAALGLTVGDVTWADCQTFDHEITTDRHRVRGDYSVGVKLMDERAEGEVILYAGGWCDLGFWSGSAADEPVEEVHGFEEPLDLVSFRRALDRFEGFFAKRV